MAVRLPGTIGLMLRERTPEFRYDSASGEPTSTAGGHVRMGIWIYPEDLTTQQELIVVADRNTTNPGNGTVRGVLRLENVTGGPGTISFFTDSILSLVTMRRSIPGTVTLNEWQHILVVCLFSINDCHIYRNGVEVTYAVTHSDPTLPMSGGGDVLFGSTYRGLDGGPHYPGGTMVTQGSLSKGYLTAPGTFFKGGIQHAGLWHEGALTSPGMIQALADGFSPTFLNHRLEASSLSHGLLMAPAFYGDGDPSGSGYDPQIEVDPVSGIKLEYTKGSGSAVWMDGPGICEPCPPEIDGPGPEVPKTPKLCLPFALPRAELYDNPGNPADLLPIVYGDFRVGGLRGPVPATMIDKGEDDVGPWVFCAAFHPVMSIESVYIDDVVQTDGFTVEVSDNFQNKGTIATITFPVQPIGQVNWRGKGLYDTTGGELMENCLDQVIHLLTTYGNFTFSEDFDLTSFYETRARIKAVGYKTAFVVLTEDVTQDWLTEMLFNVMGYWRINGKQQLEFHIDNGSSNISGSDLAATIIAARDVLDGNDGVEFTLDKQNLVNVLTAYYLYSYSLNQPSSRIITVRDEISIDAYGQAGKAVTLKGLRRDTDIGTWGTILLKRQSARSRIEGGLVSFTLLGGKFGHLTIGDLLRFSWPYGPTRADGRPYENEVLRILNLTIDVSRGGAMAITAVDLGIEMIGEVGTGVDTDIPEIPPSDQPLPPPPPIIDTAPSNPTDSTSAEFTFHDTQTNVEFVVQIDGIGGFTISDSPALYDGLSLGTHTFRVKAVDEFGQSSAATEYTWVIDGTIRDPDHFSWGTVADYKFGQTQVIDSISITAMRGHQIASSYGFPAVGQARLTLHVSNVDPLYDIGIGGVYWMNIYNGWVYFSQNITPNFSQGLLPPTDKPVGFVAPSTDDTWAYFIATDTQDPNIIGYSNMFRVLNGGGGVNENNDPMSTGDQMILVANTTDLLSVKLYGAVNLRMHNSRTVLKGSHITPCIRARAGRIPGGPTGMYVLYSPDFLSPTSMLVSGWRTAADPDDFLASMLALEDPATVYGADKVFRSDYVAGAWTAPTLMYRKLGYHVNDTSTIEIGGTLLMYYTALANADAYPSIVLARHNIGLATSVDGGTTWSDQGILIPYGSSGDGFGAWSPAAVIDRDGLLWLYYHTGTADFSAPITFRQGLSADGRSLSGVAERLTFTDNGGLVFLSNLSAISRINYQTERDFTMYYASGYGTPGSMEIRSMDILVE